MRNGCAHNLFIQGKMESRAKNLHFSSGKKMQ